MLSSPGCSPAATDSPAAGNLPLAPVEIWRAGLDEAAQAELTRAEMGRRVRILLAADDSATLRLALTELCRRDVPFFIETFCWTFDPRGTVKVLPFVLWPKQRQYLAFVAELERSRGEGIVEKSRDVGMTWMNAALFLHHWLFIPGWKGSIIADKQDTVDKVGDIDSILERVRFMLRRLPAWMEPPGFVPARHQTFMKLVNPLGASIVGKTGDNAGRGGRSSMVIIDEAAHIPRAHRIDAAVSANSDVKIWASSVNGEGNTFARKRHSGTFPVFTFHYADDPRRDEAWFADLKSRSDPVIWASEREIDYGASLENVVIPAAWVASSRTLRRRLLDYDDMLANPAAAGRARIRLAAVGERPVAGFDIGGNSAETVLITRRGPFIDPPVAWIGLDTTATAMKGLDLALERNAWALLFDPVGMGSGVVATLMRAQHGELHIEGVNTGDPPSEARWPDKRTSRDRFKNARAELWWICREAFRRAHELLLYLLDEDGGVEHAADEVALVCDDPELIRQLSTLTWHPDDRGKTLVESKDDLRSRGVKSPDRADALILTYHRPRKRLLYVGG